MKAPVAEMIRLGDLVTDRARGITYNAPKMNGEIADPYLRESVQRMLDDVRLVRQYALQECEHPSDSVVDVSPGRIRCGVCSCEA